MKGVLFLISFIFYFSFGLFYNQISTPKGDEVHYLLTAISIIKDHDLSLTNNYDNQDYLIFFQGVLDRHVVTGKGGNQYLYHGLGIFQFAVSPFWALAKRTGVTFFLSFISAILIIQMFNFSHLITKNKKLSLLVAITVGLTLPIVQYSVLVFVEILAALLLTTIAIKIIQKKTNTLSLAVLIGLLPWIHLRFIPISLFFLLYCLYKERRTITRKSILFLILSVILIISYFLFMKCTFGTFDPTRPIIDAVGRTNIRGNTLTNFVNILIDRQYGLLIYSPFYFFVFPGFAVWFKRNKKSLFVPIAASLFYLIPVLSYYDWNGGFSPPARYLVPILPILIPAIVFYLSVLKDGLAYLIIGLFGSAGILLFILNILPPPNHGFIFMDGSSPSLFKLSQILRVNIYDLLPVFYPVKQIGLTHVLWTIFLLSLTLLLTSKLPKNEKG